MILSQLESKEWDQETVSHAGAYQTEALLNWSEYHHRQFRRRMAEQHLGQYSLSIIRGYQLQAGLMAQEFGDFLKMLEAAGQGTKTLWAHLVRQVYDKFVLAGNFCLLGITFWVFRQLWYNGTKIIDSLKKRAFKTSVGTILRAFCCGIAAFMTSTKDSQTPETQADTTGGLQGQGTIDINTEAALAARRSGNDVMQADPSPDVMA